jgi:hypothetical protein
MGWTVRGSKSGGGEILRTRPDWPWDPTRSFPGLMRPERDVDHPPPSSTEVKERVELLLPWAFMASSKMNFTLHSLISVYSLKCSATDESFFSLLRNKLNSEYITYNLTTFHKICIRLWVEQNSGLLQDVSGRKFTVRLSERRMFWPKF